MEKGNRERILVVDDEAAVLNILSERLESIGYDCNTETDGLRALHRIKGTNYDLVLLDINMPYLCGTEILKGLKRVDLNTPVVMISGLDSIDIVRKTLREGAYDYLVKPLDFDDLELTVKRALEHGRLLHRNMKYQRNLEEKIEERTKELSDALEEIKKTYDATILALGSALETRDIETQAHGIRVAQYSRLIADKLGIKDRDHLMDIERGAYLHDIGKIGVPDEILRKPFSLTDDEWVIMKRHPELGKRMIEGIDFLRGAVPIVYCHHECYNGLGYPQGLRRNDIPIEARIFSVADALDAMISERVYRTALPFKQTKLIIIEESGKQFDPDVIEAFIKIPEEELLDIDHYFKNEKTTVEKRERAKDTTFV
jgi:response regulator RpfG family c-di-GMP phosphodiesterase